MQITRHTHAGCVRVPGLAGSGPVGVTLYARKWTFDPAYWINDNAVGPGNAG